ncbi:MAG: Rossmann-like and DUF2520 domain-containing protein [Acidobacteriota bacterium]
MSSNKRARAAIIGPGRVGQTLARLAKALGYELETVVARTPATARAAARRLGARQVCSVDEKFPPPQLLLIATPDDAIVETAAKLAARDQNWRHTVVLHCSGAFGSELLAPLSEQGAATGSLHPLKSFATPISKLTELHGVHWCIEGDARAVRLARRLARHVNGKLLYIDAKMKPIYHAAAVMACGHLVALVDISLTLLAECKIERSRAMEMLMPLIEGTVHNITQSGTEAALTGPFARHDYKTINRHLQALIKLKHDYMTIYSLLGRHSLRMRR